MHTGEWNDDLSPIGCRPRIRSLLGSIELWLTLSLLFVALATSAADDREITSKYWFFEPILSIVFLLALRASARFDFRINTTGRLACAFFVVSSWSIGMLTEMAISIAEGHYGGLHAKTGPSFVLAQGYYIPLSFYGLWLIRRYRITFSESFFVAGMTSLYEMMTVGLPVLISPFFLFAPVLIAFYFVIYARLLSMCLLFIDTRCIWKNNAVTISFRRKLLYGTLLGILCWATYVVWAQFAFWLFDDFRAW